MQRLHAFATKFLAGLRDPATEQATVLWGLIAAVFWSICTQGFTWDKGIFLVCLVGLRWTAPGAPPTPPLATA